MSKPPDEEKRIDAQKGAAKPAPEIASETADDGDGKAARAAALHMLDDVLNKKQPLESVLEGNGAYRALPPADRSFARMMVSSTLRHLAEIDLLLRKAAKRAEINPPALRILLRLGACQILFMNVPDYAAVNTSVELAADLGFPRQKGFVNAVLRELGREGAAWRAEEPLSAGEKIPAWLFEAWAADYGAAEAGRIAEASLIEAPLNITLAAPEQEAGRTAEQAAEWAAEWAEKLGAETLPTGSLVLPGGTSVASLPGFDQGSWWVQDAGSALPARLFGDVKGRTVLDLCAAPGGKTAQLADAGANVLALDRSASRLARLQENMTRLGLADRVAVLTGDAGLFRPAEKFSHILLDAPCSATGTLRRHPDVMHLKSPQDIGRLQQIQARLLDNALTLLAPGGVLVYCTCSLQKAEGERQIASLLRHHADIERFPVTAQEFPELSPFLTPEGELRILPMHMASQGGMDGFFAARLRRV